MSDALATSRGSLILHPALLLAPQLNYGSTQPQAFQKPAAGNHFLTNLADADQNKRAAKQSACFRKLWVVPLTASQRGRTLSAMRRWPSARISANASSATAIQEFARTITKYMIPRFEAADTLIVL